MKKNTGQVSAIVVSYNTRETTLRCLGNLLAELDPDQSEVIVVDNASGDGSADAVENRFPAVHVIRNSVNLGFARANNVAIAACSGGRFLLLNSDAFVRPGAVGALGRYLDSDPKLAAVGPRLLNADGSLQRSCFKFPGLMRSAFDFLLLTAAAPDHPWIGDHRKWPHDRDRVVDFVSGACMLVRRSAVEQIGPFDESFFFYFEEADWCKRAAGMGWKIGFTPTAEVVHEGGGSGKNQADRVFAEFQRGHERFIRKHHGPVVAVAVRTMMAIGAAVRVGVFGFKRMFGRGDAESVRRWRRILFWTLGVRGPGLAEINELRKVEAPSLSSASVVAGETR